MRTVALALILGLVGALLASSAEAMPVADGASITVTVGGSKIKLRKFGDESLHWYEDPQDRVVSYSGGTFYYVTESSSGGTHAVVPLGTAIPTSEQPSSRSEFLRSARSSGRFAVSAVAPVSGGGVSVRGTLGNHKCLVLLLRFAEHKARTLPSPKQIDTLLNAKGGHATICPHGSVADYFAEVSDGKMTYEASTGGWIQLSEKESDSSDRFGSTLYDAIRTEIARLDVTTDLSKFDGDGDGIVDSVLVIHSGYGAEHGGVDPDGALAVNRVWSHAHRGGRPVHTSPDGVVVDSYAVAPGLWGFSGGDTGRIGVIVHELGHVLGLSDLYDPDVGGAGIGRWGVMGLGAWGWAANSTEAASSGQHRPSHFCAWSKMRCGWIKPTVVTGPGTYLARTLSGSSGNCFVIQQGYPGNEYLLIENRQPQGFDSDIPAGTGGVGGLAIWHVDAAKLEKAFGRNLDRGFPGQPGWPANGRHYGLALLQADGKYDLEQRPPPTFPGEAAGDGDDLYRAGLAASITASSTPSVRSYSGGAFVDPGFSIESISKSGKDMTFEVVQHHRRRATFCRYTEELMPSSGLRSVSGDANVIQLDVEVPHAGCYTVAASFGFELQSSSGKARNVILGISDLATFGSLWGGSRRRLTCISGYSYSVTIQDTESLTAGKHTIYLKAMMGSHAQLDLHDLHLRIEECDDPTTCGSAKLVAKPNRVPVAPIRKAVHESRSGGR